MSPMPITSVTVTPSTCWMWLRIAGMPPPGSPPVTIWVTSSIRFVSVCSSLLARYWAKEGVERSVSARPDLRPKMTRSVSPGATGTDLQPMRESTKCVWPATNGPAPNVVSTLLWSWMPVAK